MSKRQPSDTGGFISCKCKTPYAKSSIARVGIGSNKKLKKLHKKYANNISPHAYGVDKGTRLNIGDALYNTCKCSLFSGKDRSTRRHNRKNKSVIRARNLKGIDNVMVTFT